MSAGHRDTIAAVATAPGRGGVGIVRLSGPDALRIAEHLSGAPLRPRYAHFRHFRDAAGEIIDSGIAIGFPAPGSFTGEHVAELQAHGGPVVLDLLLQACLQHGARHARPGEYSERAYLNGKLDLAQAEAVADLVNSGTESAARSATRSLQGLFSRRIRELVGELTRLRVYVEAAIDFPEEEIDFIAEGEVAAQLARLLDSLDGILTQARRGVLLREGMKLVIAGRPNAGKSSLLNALSGEDRAIVTPIEGTTRDVLREHIQLDGLPLHIVDTAGLRDGGDAVEQEGIRRAWQEIDTADRILLVVDGCSGVTEPGQIWPAKDRQLTRHIPVTVIVNKCDLSGETPRIEAGPDGSAIVHLSARTGAGLDLLRRHLKASAGFAGSEEGSFTARRRHLDALQRARDFLLAGCGQLSGPGAGELLAEDLRQCQRCLGEITGEFTTDQLLGEIFSSFCIGK